MAQKHRMFVAVLRTLAAGLIALTLSGMAGAESAPLPLAGAGRQMEKLGRVAGAEFRDAATGKLLWGQRTTTDNGRGMTADVDPRYPGSECWSAAVPGLFSAKGELITNRKPRSCNFAAWWDGRLLRNLLDRTLITRWNWETSSEETILTAEDCASNNGTKATPCLAADILGDWREEVIWRTADNHELRIYVSTCPTDYRIYTLMHDPVYRLGIAWQNVAYNQPPHTGFWLGEGLKSAPRPNITLVNPGQEPADRAH